MAKKTAHHGGHHKGGHSKGKKTFGTSGGHNGLPPGTGRHMNHTQDCSPGACGHDQYFQGTNEDQYEGGA